MNSKAMSETMMMNLIYLVIVVFVAGVIAYNIYDSANNSRGYADYYSKEIVKIIDLSENGDVISLDVLKATEIAKKNDIALEINAYPERLDLPDSLVFDAGKAGLTFCINTDAHAVEHMDLMRYGVSVARRGWAKKRDIVNALSYNNFKKWLMKN